MRRATYRLDERGVVRRFNSRPSCDGRLEPPFVVTPFPVSIHARHATGDLIDDNFRKIMGVSIHARHATGDAPEDACCLTTRVSIHARHATGDGDAEARRGGGSFQFTPVMRRATGRVDDDLCERLVSIHARHATGDCVVATRDVEARVSIHARHATGDCDNLCNYRHPYVAAPPQNS